MILQYHFFPLFSCFGIVTVSSLKSYDKIFARITKKHIHNLLVDLSMSIWLGLCQQLNSVLKKSKRFSSLFCWHSFRLYLDDTIRLFAIQVWLNHNLIMLGWLFKLNMSVSNYHYCYISEFFQYCKGNVKLIGKRTSGNLSLLLSILVYSRKMGLLNCLKNL